MPTSVIGYGRHAGLTGLTPVIHPLLPSSSGYFLLSLCLTIPSFPAILNHMISLVSLVHFFHPPTLVLCVSETETASETGGDAETVGQVAASETGDIGPDAIPLHPDLLVRSSSFVSRGTIPEMVAIVEEIDERVCTHILCVFCWLTSSQDNIGRTPEDPRVLNVPPIRSNPPTRNANPASGRTASTAVRRSPVPLVL